jgi:hypothetical protein
MNIAQGFGAAAHAHTTKNKIKNKQNKNKKKTGYFLPWTYALFSPVTSKRRWNIAPAVNMVIHLPCAPTTKSATQ